MVQIKEPIWKSHSIGIKSDRLDETIEILYQDKHGTRLWPGKYRVDLTKLDGYSEMMVGRDRDVPVTIIPISDLLQAA